MRYRLPYRSASLRACCWSWRATSLLVMAHLHGGRLSMAKRDGRRNVGRSMHLVDDRLRPATDLVEDAPDVLADHPEHADDQPEQKRDDRRQGGEPGHVVPAE